MRILGLDEAGRGAVLGPLVVGAFLVDEDKVKALKKAGATDSKLLSKKKRESLIDPLSAIGEGVVESVSARAIDAENINTLEERAFARLINRFEPDHVIIDAPVHPKGIPNFTLRLKALLTCTPSFTIEPKADLNYAPVGAASIFAKVTRDHAIEALGEVGSGYPSDPYTVAWIKAALESEEALPACIRTRWGTVRKLTQRELF